MGYQLVVEPYQWGSTAPAAPLLRLQTPTGAAARLALPAGRHLARLVTNLDRLHALDLRSNAPFQMADINTVCCFLPSISPPPDPLSLVPPLPILPPPFALSQRFPFNKQYPLA